MRHAKAYAFQTALAYAVIAGIGALVFAPVPVKAAVLTTGAQNPPYGGHICADVKDDSLHPGVLIQALACHGGANQEFELIGEAIYAVSGLRCMDVEGNGNGGAAGTPVDAYTCTGGANQQWYYAGGQIISLQSGLCLDATSSTNNTVLVVNACNGLNSQQWQFK